MQDFLSTLSRTKMIPRSGWISHGVSLPDVESVADHSFSTALLATLMADIEFEHGRRVDVERVLRMALLHDLSETLTFDISKEYLTYLGNRGKAIKNELDEAATRHVLTAIKEPKISRKYVTFQREFDAERSIESKIVHDADYLDILLQVVEYAKRGYSKRLLAPLWNSTEKELRKSKLQSSRQLGRIVSSLYRKQVFR
jgi:putative hydrolase of HD superfamily